MSLSPEQLLNAARFFIPDVEYVKPTLGDKGRFTAVTKTSAHHCPFTVDIDWQGMDRYPPQAPLAHENKQVFRSIFDRLDDEQTLLVEHSNGSHTYQTGQWIKQYLTQDPMLAADKHAAVFINEAWHHGWQKKQPTTEGTDD